MSMEESISLEETNKIRISLGLKPLTDDAAPADSQEKQAEDNYAKQRERETKQREAKKIADRIAKVKNRHELHASLKGATLGDADGDDDTLKWIKKAKKREKELAKKRLEELENMDKMFQDEYTERDLEGLKVSHDFEGMDEGEARILTLKDSRILDNEEDELQNVEMAEEERNKKKKENTIKKRNYTGYDDEEGFNDGTQLMKRAVLAKYDEDIEGPMDNGLRLGSSSTMSKKEVQAERQQQAAAAVNKSLLSIDYVKNLETADYLKEGDVGFKKPKMKKKRHNRRAPAEAELADPNEMEVDQGPIVPRERDLDANFVDDDELQAALARSRKAKLRKTKKQTPEELAQKLLEQQREEDENAMEIIKVEEESPDLPEGDSAGLTFDSTSEFVRVVGTNPVPARRKPEVEAETREPSVVKQRSQSRDVSMAPGDQALDEMEVDGVNVKDEDEEDDMAILDRIENALKEADAEAEESKQDILDDGVGTTGEQTHRTGMAATLNILRQQGILSTPSPDIKDREHVQLQRDLWLAEQRRRVAQREMERLQSRGGNKDQAQREYENRMREQQEARENLESFKNYKPDVNIVYYDEYGRSLTPKEAWKALSHKFHGKGSGKMKTEKKLKKIAEEKKQAAMASGDTPLSMSAAFQQRQEKTGQAHFVLSVGNRGAVPQASEFLDAQPLAKGKTEKTKKKKAGKNGQTLDSDFITLPGHQLYSSSIRGSPAPGSGVGSPMPKAGFSRIGSATEPSSQGGTPVPGERSKVAFGFGTKRKATEEAAGSPQPKRR